ncbi:MAG: NUDIX domain-containing protein [Parachlamydiaceae bacterium]|nr:NUDIX domain-containing protein [Parachlamydiaceae bacterium]
MQQVTRFGVYGVAIRDGKILLITKKPQGCYPSMLDLPGGGIEFGETAEDTLRREFSEEVGMTFQKMHLLDNLSNCMKITHLEKPFLFHHVGQIYQVEEWEVMQHIQPEEIFSWYRLSDLNHDILTPLTRKALHLPAIASAQKC